jgi:hypothetical protein
MSLLALTNNCNNGTPEVADFLSFFQKEGSSSDLMDRSIASIEFMDFKIPTVLFSSREIMQLMDIDTNMEPKPLSDRNIHLVERLPLTSILSQDLLRNCHEYCEALKLVTIEDEKRGLTTPTGTFEKLHISCPKSVVPRGSSSDASIVSSGSESVHIYDYQQERWMDRYHQLATFFLKCGHSDVSNEFDSNLAGWVRRQRHQFKRAKQGRRSTLTLERVKLLEQVGFKWDFHDLAWKENFERLQQFYRIHQHCNVTTCSSGMSKEENDRLLNWCKRQKRAIRTFMKNKDAVGSRMNQMRLELLESIGFHWQPIKKDAVA